MKRILLDRYGRQLNYLRLSVTDRCNFRCYYCMPEEGVNFAKREELLSYEELLRLSHIFCNLGVQKIRITGGEPFVRSGIIPFLEKLTHTKGLQEITVTTNGTLSTRHITTLKKLGITKINISLDSLDRERFSKITRRDRFDEVYSGIMQLVEGGFEIKLNCVVAAGKNTQDIVPFIELTRKHHINVRFLEEMPFNGSNTFLGDHWSYKTVLDHIKTFYTQVDALVNEPTSTSVNYKIPGYAGSFGVIPALSRTFCGTCNRIRLSATGELRTCLYGSPAADMRELLRGGATDEEIEDVLIAAVSNRAKDGFEAEAQSLTHEYKSMSVLGG